MFFYQCRIVALPLALLTPHRALCRLRRRSGFLLNFGVYYATREALGLPFVWLPPVAFLARFMTVYAAVIAVTKDLGDIEGDKKGGARAAREGCPRERCREGAARARPSPAADRLR